MDMTCDLADDCNQRSLEVGVGNVSSSHSGDCDGPLHSVAGAAGWQGRGAG